MQNVNKGRCDISKGLIEKIIFPIGDCLFCLIDFLIKYLSKSEKKISSISPFKYVYFVTKNV